MSRPPTVTVFRPLGPDELRLVKQTGFTAWPPRRPEQPIFYPVTNEDYAIEITRRWNVKQFGVGYVACFEVACRFMDEYQIHIVGAAHHAEWWIPAEDLEMLNRNIVGKIEIIGTYFD